MQMGRVYKRPKYNDKFKDNIETKHEEYVDNITDAHAIEAGIEWLKSIIKNICDNLSYE
jgi:hypothetical protein